MCESCEKDLEQFNKSLRNKTNLLNADMERRASFFEFDNNQEKSGAPRNRKDSFDSGEDYDPVIN